MKPLSTGLGLAPLSALLMLAACGAPQDAAEDPYAEADSMVEETMGEAAEGEVDCETVNDTIGASAGPAEDGSMASGPAGEGGGDAATPFDSGDCGVSAVD
jgi:hypothetical protein